MPRWTSQESNGAAMPPAVCWTDLILVDFPGTPTYWFENPKNEGAWKKHTAAAVSNNESPQYVDADGDGKRDLLMAIAPPAGPRPR